MHNYCGLPPRVPTHRAAGSAIFTLQRYSLAGGTPPTVAGRTEIRIGEMECRTTFALAAPSSGRPTETARLSKNASRRYTSRECYNNGITSKRPTHMSSSVLL